MADNSGFHMSGAPYEYTVAEAKSRTLTFKKITLVALYVLYAATLLLVGGAFELIVPLLALIPITLWMLVFFTWRLTQVEYEYSFFGGTLTVCRVLGGRTRRVLAEVTLRELSSVCVCDDRGALCIERFDPEKTVFAASSPNAPDLCAALWSEEDGTRKCLYFQPNEKAVKILRYYNRAAVELPHSGIAAERTDV